MAPSRADDPTRSLSPGKRPDLGPPRHTDDSDAWEERLLGFDARISSAAAWSPVRRDEFLLRPEVPCPHSIDPQVWPSLFDGPGQTRPGYVGFFQDLWEDLEQLQITLAARDAQPTATVVAVTVRARQTGWTGRSPLAPVLGGRVFDAFSGLPLPLPYARPSTRLPTWPLLGFDVADVFGQSGLSNCGYGLGFGREEVRTRFAPRLGDNHLFDDANEADEFRHLCDTRVPEHAPFFIYGVWLIA